MECVSCAQTSITNTLGLQHVQAHQGHWQFYCELTADMGRISGYCLKTGNCIIIARQLIRLAGTSLTESDSRGEIGWCSRWEGQVTWAQVKVTASGEAVTLTQVTSGSVSILQCQHHSRDSWLAAPRTPATPHTTWAHVASTWQLRSLKNTLHTAQF